MAAIQQTTKSHLYWLWLTLVVLVADQISKYWAEHILAYNVLPVFSWFDFSLAHNTGAAFSFLNDAGGWQQVFFVVLALTVSVVLCVMMHRLKAPERHLAIAYALIVGGALGNAIDRLIYQYVIDFIHWFYLDCGLFGMQDCHWPTFNIADVAIFIGAVLLIFEAFGVTFLNRPNFEEKQIQS